MKKGIVIVSLTAAVVIMCLPLLASAVDIGDFYSHRFFGNQSTVATSNTQQAAASVQAAATTSTQAASTGTTQSTTQATSTGTTQSTTQQATSTGTTSTTQQATSTGTSSITIPAVSGPANTDASGSATFTLASQLDASKLKELWAAVTVDGKTDYWKLDPSMISADGKSINMKFDTSKYDGKTMSLQFYGIDQDNKQTSFANQVTIKVGTSTTTTTTQEAKATYDAAKGTLTYTGADGKEVSKTLTELGIKADWMNELVKLGGTLSVQTKADGSVALIVGKDSTGAKKWEYDPSAHLTAHYTGDVGKEKCSVVTSEESYKNYIWGSKDAADPGKGPDGHMVVQRFNYDTAGALKTVDYFTWCAGDRAGTDKARYMYRQDTVKASTTTATTPSSTVTATGSTTATTADCKTATDCSNITTKYYNDPFPVDWDPVMTLTVSKDSYGRYIGTTKDGKVYLLTTRVDGFDADKDGKSGADEMNAIDWSKQVGKEITVRGHEVVADSAGEMYSDGKKAGVFAVVDVISSEETATLKASGKFDSTVSDMQKVAAGVDPVQSGLVGNNTQAAMGFVNLFNGAMPTTDQLSGTQHITRLMTGLAPKYLDNIKTADMTAIRPFATIDLETALKAEEARRSQAQSTSSTSTSGTNTGTTSTTQTGSGTTSSSGTNSGTSTTNTGTTQSSSGTSNAANTSTTSSSSANPAATTDEAAKKAVDDLLKKSEELKKASIAAGGTSVTQVK